VIGQELGLHQEQQKDRRDYKCSPSDHAQQKSKQTLAEVPRASEKLDKNITR
jgi:hypothetical protein